MAVTLDLSVVAKILESASENFGGPSRLPVNFDWSLDQASGTTLGTNDVLFADSRSLAATTEDLDLLGGLTSQLTGAAVSFVDVSLVMIRNTSTASGEVLTIGGATNPWVTGPITASGDLIEIPPGGFLIWYAGAVDDASPVASTGDIVTVDSGAATITYEIVVVGRSA